MVPWWRSFAFRFVALYTGVAVVLVLLGLAGLYQREKEEVAGKFGLTLESIAGTAAPFLAGEDLDAIRSNSDANGEAFGRVRAILDRVAKENGLGPDQVYILRPAGDHFEFVAMLQQRTFVGDRYDPPPALQQLYLYSLNDKDTVRTPLYKDAHGDFISGIAPVLRKDGTPAGLLQVDFGMSKYLAAVEGHRDVYLAGLGVMVLLFLIFGSWMNRRLRKNVAALVRGTRAIQREEYDHRVEVRSTDEIRAVADALNQALAGLKERFEMLKFLPRHTATMIAAAAKQGRVDRSIARRVDLAVFHSDIRGFTSLSAAIAPEAMVAMLNDYIRVQAELVEAAGGSIDKYMGDAVLAVFEGEHKERRAVECALAIQDAVAKMNAAHTFQAHVLIGIGITSGSVVMGNMGSDQRMEYTVIGSPVNLSARFCSQAQGGEIVVSGDVKSKLDQQIGLHFAAEERVKVKGFDEAVSCWRTSGQAMPV